MASKQKLLGIYAYMDDLIAGLSAARAKGLTVDTVYSPVPRHEVMEALGVKPSPVRFMTLAGGITGVLSGVGLAVYTSLQWNFIVSGKPIVPLIPSVIVGFEFCILFSILFNFTGMLLFARLPNIRMPEAYDPRFSQDRFGLVVRYAEEDRMTAEGVLKESGAEEIHDA